MGILQTMTIDAFKEEILPSVRRTDKNGGIIPDAVYWAALRAAAAYLARYLDLHPILGNAKAIYVEEKDYTQWDPEAWCLKCMINRPVRSVEEMKIQLGDHDPYIVDPTWVNVVETGISGQVVIIRGKANQSLNAAMTWWSRSFYAGNHVPLLFKLRLKAGFEKEFPGTVSGAQGQTTVTATITGSESLYTELNGDPVVIIGTAPYRVISVLSSTEFEVDSPLHATLADDEMIVASYPEELRAAVQRLAAIPLLDQIGTYLLGQPGLTGKTGSLDALSQGRGYNKKGPYAALIDSYANFVKEAKEQLYSTYGPVNFSAL